MSSTPTILGSGFVSSLDVGSGSNHQFHPSVAALSNGGFVATWYSYAHEDGDRGSIVGQLYDANGVAVSGGMFVASSDAGYGSGQQVHPSVAALSNGGFVVAWQSDNAEDGNGWSILGQVYDASGNALANGDFIASSDAGDTSGDQEWPGVSGLANGGFVVTWHTADTSIDGNGAAVVGQRYDASGNAVSGGDFVATTDAGHATGDQKYSYVITLNDGSTVVAWYSDNAEDGSGGSIVGVRYDASGNLIASSGFVATTDAGYASADQSDVSMTALADGGFVVVWNSAGTEDGSSSATVGQRYDANGVAVGSGFVASLDSGRSTGDQATPSVAALDDGGFIISWRSGNSSDDGSGYGIVAVRYDTDGDVVSDGTVVPSTDSGYSAGNQYVPVVTGTSDGGFAVVWMSLGGEDDGGAIVGQKYSVPNITTATITADDASLKIGETTTINIELSESSSNFTVDDISVTGGALSNFTGSGTSYSALFTPGALDGNATFNIAANTFTNLAGNDNAAASELTVAVDTIAPVVTNSNISITGGSGTNNAFKVGDTVTVAWGNSADGNTDIASVTADLSDFGGSSTATMSLNSGTYTATFVIANLGTINTNTASASVTATDDAGNSSSTSASTTHTLDNGTPNAPSAPDMSAASDSGDVTIVAGANSDDTTITTRPSFSGTGEEGATITLSSDVDGVIGIDVVSGGTWTIVSTTDLSLGAHAISATATDAVGNVSAASTALDIDINQTPVATDDNVQVVSYNNTSGTIDLLDNDSDPTGDGLDHTLTLQNTGLSGTTNGTASVSNNELLYVPTSGFESSDGSSVSTDTLTYTISDPYGETDTASVEVYVNSRPVATDQDRFIAVLNTPLTLDVLANDTDNDIWTSGTNPRVNQTLQVVGISNEVGGTVTITNGGDDVLFTPTTGFTGRASFTYTVSDGVDSVSSNTVYVHVAASPTYGTSGNDEVDAIGHGGADGDDTIENMGHGSIIDAGDGDNTIDATGHDGVVVAGTGTDNIVSTGHNSVVSAGAGDDVINNVGHGSQVDAGEGNDTITSMGHSTILNGGEGNDTISSTGHSSTINGGDGDDTLYGIIGNSGTLTGGRGSDTFIYNDRIMRNDTITDFDATEDVIKLKSLLLNFDAGTSDINDYVRLVDDGADELLQIDRDGSGNGLSFQTHVRLEGLNGDDAQTWYNLGVILVES